jgi:hypothetical protein
MTHQSRLRNGNRGLLSAVPDFEVKREPSTIILEMVNYPSWDVTSAAAGGHLY